MGQREGFVPASLAGSQNYSINLLFRRVAESQEDEKKLTVSRDKAATNVEERLVKAYNRIRGNAENGLAVVMVRRGACGGCFNIVPPQRQADIKDKKKIIVCEHCGRILADVDAIEIVRR